MSRGESCFCTTNERGGIAVLLIADDPIIDCMQRWGLPPWLCGGGAFEDDEEDEEYGI